MVGNAEMIFDQGHAPLSSCRGQGWLPLVEQWQPDTVISVVEVMPAQLQVVLVNLNFVFNFVPGCVRLFLLDYHTSEDYAAYTSKMSDGSDDRWDIHARVVQRRGIVL